MFIQKQSQVSIEQALQSSNNPFANTPTPVPDDHNQSQAINQHQDKQSITIHNLENLPKAKPSALQINQPLIVQPVLPEEIILTQDQKRNLIRKINGLWILQKVFQVALCIISAFSISYENLFYDYETHRFRVTIPIIVSLIFTLLLIVRFVDSFRKGKLIQIIVYVFYCVLYSILISSLISQGYENSIPIKDFFIFGFICSLGSIGELIILIQFYFQIQSFKFQEFRLTFFLKSIFQGPIPAFFAVFVLFGNYAIAFVLLFEIIWVCLFTALYITSLLQIYNGKFHLREDDFFAGSVLAYINMFLPCL